MRAAFPLRLLQQGHGMWRRFSAGVTLGVRVILEHDDGLVLVRHTYVPGWQFPGGGVDGGEAAVDAASREVREETGIHVTDVPQLVGFYLNAGPNSRDHVALYRCREFSLPDPWPRRSLEIAECRIFPLHGLPVDLSEATQRRLAEINGAVDLSPNW